MSDEEKMTASKLREQHGLPPAVKPRAKTDEEIRQLVMDVAGGIVFCDWMIPDEQIQHMMSMVFMPIALMGKEDAEKLAEEECSMVYEYMEKAGPRSVNGLPGFFSFQFLNCADHDFFGEEMEKYLELQREFMGDEDNNDSEPDDADGVRSQ